jgi:hypothetical protein
MSTIQKIPVFRGLAAHHGDLSEKREQIGRITLLCFLTDRDISIENSFANSAPYHELLRSYQSGTGLAHWIGKG